MYNPSPCLLARFALTTFDRAKTVGGAAERIPRQRTVPSGAGVTSGSNREPPPLPQLKNKTLQLQLTSVLDLLLYPLPCSLHQTASGHQQRGAALAEQVRVAGGGWRRRGCLAGRGFGRAEMAREVTEEEILEATGDNRLEQVTDLTLRERGLVALPTLLLPRLKSLEVRTDA